MLDENMGAAHRGLHCPWPPGRPRCPSVPGRSLDDLYRTYSGEASYHTDEGEVVRGGAEQSRTDQINQMQQLSHTTQPTTRTTKDTGEKHKLMDTPKVSDRRCTPRKTQKYKKYRSSPHRGECHGGHRETKISTKINLKTHVFLNLAVFTHTHSESQLVLLGTH